MSIRTVFMILIVWILLLISISLHAESPFRSSYIVTSEYHSTTGKGGERRNNLHEGIDLWCLDPIIFSALPGKVVKVIQDLIYGKNVTIEHYYDIGKGKEIFYTFYAHGSKIYYSASGEVTTNTAIMRMGTTGYSSGDHLHFGAFRIVAGEKIYFDPSIILEMEEGVIEIKRGL